MESNTEKGKFILYATAAWLIFKNILNFVIDLFNGNGNLGVIANIIIAVIIAASMFFLPNWIRYIVALFLIVVFLQHLIPNLKNLLGWGAIYLIEGIVDVFLATLLMFNSNITAYYKSKK